MAAAAPSMTSKLVAEFVGTFMLIFTIGCAVQTGSGEFAGFAIGTVLFIVIMCLGNISGANFNPAVSVTLGITKTMGGPGLPWSDVVAYCIVQVVAGLAAAFGYTFMLGGSIHVAPAEGFSLLAACACETLYTFMLCFVVLNVAVAKKNAKEKNQYYGLAIGFCVVAGAYGAGAVSGGCFNPAVALGLDASSFYKGFGKSLAYIGAELVGAAIAAALFAVVRLEDFEEIKFYHNPHTVKLVSQLVSEFLGTYILVLTVGLNVCAGAKAAALSIAASLAAMIYALGDVSGAHFNPAVTFAIFSSRRDENLTVSQAGSYMLMQMVGGVAAAVTYAGIYKFDKENLPKVGPGEGHFLPQALISEFIFTFLLAFTVLCVAVSAQTKASHYFGLCIGFCIVVGGFAIGGVSGGALNPAVAFGLASVGSVKGIVYAAGYAGVELAAGAFAAGVFRLTHDPELDSEAAKNLVNEKV